MQKLQYFNEPALKILHGKSIVCELLVNASLKFKIRQMCFFKRFQGCAPEAGTDTVLDIPMWIPYSRNIDLQAYQNRHCFSHVVFHSHHDWLKSSFICKFLLTVYLVKGVTQFYSEQAKLPRIMPSYDPQELTEDSVALPDASVMPNTHLWTQNPNSLIPLAKQLWARHSPQWKVDGSCCHAVNSCCPYWFGPHLSVPSSLLQSPRFLWEHIWSGSWMPPQLVLSVLSQLS